MKLISCSGSTVTSRSPRRLNELTRAQKRVCGATYNKRVPPFETLGRLMAQEGKDPNQGGLWPAELLPGGFVLVKMDVYKEIKWPWYAECYQWPGETGVEALKEFLRCNYSTAAPEEMLATLDNTPVAEWVNAVFKVESAHSWRFFSEDLFFCRKLIKANIPLFCDLDLTFKCVHLGTNEVTCRAQPASTASSVLVAAQM